MSKWTKQQSQDLQRAKGNQKHRTKERRNQIGKIGTNSFLFGARDLERNHNI